MQTQLGTSIAEVETYKEAIAGGGDEISADFHSIPKNL